MTRKFLFRLLASTLLALSAAAQTPEYKLLRSQSGPSGNVVAGKLIIDQPRSRFVFPQDKSFVVYFEWTGPLGDHVLTAIWKGPDGRVVTMSPEVRLRTESPEFGAYWSFEPAASMPSGYSTVDIRIDGQPAGSHPFELVLPAATPEPPRADPPAAATKEPPSTDAVYKSVRDSVVWVYRLDETGRRVDTASGFVIAPGQVATAFQIIDSAIKLEVEFEGGRRATTNELAGFHRLEDWAVLKVDTAGLRPIPAGDPAKIEVAERVLVFQVEKANERSFGGVDVTGTRVTQPFGPRLLFNPALSQTAVGGPLLNRNGEVVGIVGGSTLPGSRFDPRNLSLSPALFLSMGVNHAATPVTAVRPTALVDLATLHSNGAMSRPIRSSPSFQIGGTGLAGKSIPPGSLPPSVSDFSHNDGAVWVYSLWQRKERLSKGTMAAEVYDAQNRLRVNVAPKKINIPSEAPVRYSFAVPVQTLEAGTYRIDLLFEGAAVWRTFVTVTD